MSAAAPAEVLRVRDWTMDFNAPSARHASGLTIHFLSGVDGVSGELECEAAILTELIERYGADEAMRQLGALCFEAQEIFERECVSAYDGRRVDQGRTYGKPVDCGQIENRRQAS